MTQDSIYYYKPGEFRNFNRRIDDKSLSVSEALSPFREIKCLGNEFKKITIQELIDKPSLIPELSKALRNGIAPESKFKLPYKKEEREQELIENLAEIMLLTQTRLRRRLLLDTIRMIRRDKNSTMPWRLH